MRKRALKQETTVGSICEMFYFRFKVTIIRHEAKVYSKVLKCLLDVRRFCNLAVIFVEIYTFPARIADQTRTLASLRTLFPDMPPEISCYSCVYAIGKNVHFWLLISFWMTNICISFASAAIAIFYVNKFLKNKEGALSAETTKLQKMLLMSLFIQVCIKLNLFPNLIRIRVLFTQF